MARVPTATIVIGTRCWAIDCERRKSDRDGGPEYVRGLVSEVMLREDISGETERLMGRTYDYLHSSDALRQAFELILAAVDDRGGTKSDKE